MNVSVRIAYHMTVSLPTKVDAKHVTRLTLYHVRLTVTVLRLSYM